MKRFAWLLLVLAGLLSLTGCNFKSGDSLYSLPQAPEEYYDLQAALNQVLNTGAAYAAPVNGSNRQSTQSVDLDADGEKEVVAFFKREDRATLEVYVFDEQDGVYTASAAIEGSGSAIDSVEYVQLDDSPGLELIVGWQVSDSAQFMSVYSLRDWHITELMSASYSEYCTVAMEDGGYDQIFLIKLDSELRTGTAQLYSYDGAQLEKKNDAALSAGMGSLKRIVTGRIEGGAMAVFVAGTYGESGMVTDVFTLVDGEFRNISSTDGSGVSSQTVRNYYVYAADIDADGIMELPQTRELPVWPTDSGEVFCLIDWCGISDSGQMTRKLTTFHNYASGWYLELPEAYRDGITVYRQASPSGLWTYVFAAWDETAQSAAPLFEIQANGDLSRLPKQRDEMELGIVSDVQYLLEILDDSVLPEELISRFRPVRTDWFTGEMQ